MVKINNDKYYTPVELAEKLLETTKKVLESEEITHIVEPSAGSGSFLHAIKKTNIPFAAFDIEPEGEEIVKADFLKLEIPYKKGRLCITNPPYGERQCKSIKFYKKCCEIGDYIAFVQPISQLDNNLQLYEFDLIHSQDLGMISYSGRKLHCCFNVYKRPESGNLNPPPKKIKLKDITIKEYRRTYMQRKGIYTMPQGWDFAICNWGNGCFGKTPQYVGQYAQEVYFYVNNKKFRKNVEELLQLDKIREQVKSISGKRISVARLYSYFKNNIDGIE